MTVAKVPGLQQRRRSLLRGLNIRPPLDVHKMGGRMLPGTPAKARRRTVAGHLPGDLRPEVVRQTVRRTAYDTNHDHEAGTVTTIILECACVPDIVAHPATVNNQDQNRVNDAFADRLGWL